MTTEPLGPDRPPRPEWLTWANLVTCVRLALLPVFVTVAIGNWYAAALTVLVAVGASDFLDGFLARRLGQVTALGSKLDPIADRLTVVTVTGTLVYVGLMPWWIFPALILPDVILTVLVRGMQPPRVHWVGKVRTALLLIGLPGLLAGHLWASPNAVMVAMGAIVLGTIGHVIAAVRYGTLMVRARRALRSPEPQPETLPSP